MPILPKRFAKKRIIDFACKVKSGSFIIKAKVQPMVN
jgi:hypothetical protein